MAELIRADGRRFDELRPLAFHRDYTEMADGCALAVFGRTKVLCTASVSSDVPPWLRDQNSGWVTAEYSMLPGSTPGRVGRRAGGRVKEIQRLIGRSLRAAVDLSGLGQFTITVDCDALQADGGTRVASICGGYLALHDAISRLVQQGRLHAHPVIDHCAAVSVGVVGGAAVLDLPYHEDANAEVDLNVVMTGSGRFVEVQGTAEGQPFSRGVLDELLDLATAGISRIVAAQKALLAVPPEPRAC